MRFEIAGVTLVLLAATVAPVMAQIGPGPFAAFPSADATDGRFLGFGCTALQTLEAPVSLTISADPTSTDMIISIFDGETGGVDGNGDKHWDLGARQLAYRLYYDPFRTGNSDPADLVGEWFGNAANPIVDPDADPDPEWTSSSATMPDNDWWGVTVQTSPAAQATPGGFYFYHLQIGLDGDCGPGEQVESSIKVAASNPLSFAASRFAFVAPLRQIFNDGPIVYPTWDGLFPFDFVTAPTTFDGGFEFGVNIPAGTLEFVLVDGDFDFGTDPAQLFGTPSGVPLVECEDDNDPDTLDDYSNLPPEIAGTPGGEAAQGPGQPSDDSQFDVFRRGEGPGRVGCVRYEVTDPLGNLYTNANPSGNSEWERFRIVSSSNPDASDPSTYDFLATTATLPEGIWSVRFAGLDMSNLTFIFATADVCSNLTPPGGGEPVPACPPPRLLIGDTVWFDIDGDGLQDPDETGIEGVLVHVTSALGGPAPIASFVTGDAGEPLFSTCTQFNTGLDEDGLYCFALPEGTYTVQIDPSNFEPGGPLEGLFSTTGGEAQTAAVENVNVLTFDFGYNVLPPEPPGTGTIGYWKNHPEAWPVDELTVGGRTLSRDDWIAFMKARTNRLSKEEKWARSLAVQLIAAKLNVLIGNASDCVDAAIAAADQLLADNGWLLDAATWRSSGEALKSLLDDYNNGRLCAPHRS